MKNGEWVLTCSLHVLVAGVKGGGGGGGGTKRKRRVKGAYPQCKGCSRPPTYEEYQKEARRRYKEQQKLGKLKSKIEQKKVKAGDSKKKKRKIK